MKLYSRFERQSRLQQICLWLVLGVAVRKAQTWTNTFAAAATYMVGASADGSKLVAACGDGDLYISTNSGIDWVQHSGLANSTVVASSADGNVLFDLAGLLCASTNSGKTWGSLTNAPSYNHRYGVQFIVCSGNGSKVLVAVGSGPGDANFLISPLFTSPDYGITWISNSAPITNWQSAAGSADGSKLVAAYEGVGRGGGIYTSTNFGATWISNSVPRLSWAAVACSADGNNLVAAADHGGIYTSTNFGVTWVSNNVPKLAWSSLCSSADGSRLVAAAGGYYQPGPIYSSTNYGANWVSNSVPVAGWMNVVSSADGYRRFASVYKSLPGVFCSAAMPSPPLMNITNAGGDLLVSWLVPSAHFLTQRSVDLFSWAGVTNTPVLDFTNLRYQIVLHPANNGGFYRLATP